MTPDFSLTPAVYYRWVFPTLRIALLYEEATFAVEPWKLELWPEDWRDKEESYKAQVGQFCRVGLLENENLELTFQPRAPLSPTAEESYYRYALGPHLKYVHDRGLDILVGDEFFEDYLRLAPSTARGQTARIKRARLRWLILNHVIDQHIPGFAPNAEGLPGNLKSVVRAFREGIDSFVRGRQVSEVTPEVSLEIDTEIANKESRLHQILDTERVGQLTPSGREILASGSSALVSHFVPLGGTLIMLLNRLLRAEVVRREGLRFVIALSVLRRVLSTPPSTGSECQVCAHSMAEIEEMSEEVAMKPPGPLCEGHVVAYLNCRKFTQLVGRDLWTCMKALTFRNLES